MNATVCVSPNGQDVSWGAGTARVLFVSSVDGVSRLERSSTGRWTVTGRSLLGAHVGSLFYDGDSGSLFAGAHTGGCFVSVDQGGAWEARTTGLTHPHVFTLAGRKENGETVLYAGTEPAALFRSADGGLHWREIPGVRLVPGAERWTFPPSPHVAHVKNIAFHPTRPGTLWVCVEQGALLRTEDGGASWKELDHYYSASRHAFYKDCHRVRISASDPDVMYMTGGDGLFSTADGGNTWAQLADASMRIGYPDALHLLPDDGRSLLIAGARREPGRWPEERTADACIMISRDKGANWQQVGNGLPPSLHGNVEAVSMHVFDSGIEFFAGTTDGQVFIGYDHGKRWELIADRLPAVSKANHHIQAPQLMDA